jgi:hypothetical protein
MDEQSAELERALGYPYAIPSHSYVLVEGEARELAAVEVDLPERIPLLAYGSNAAPAILAQKLKGTTDPVPVVRAALHDFDVVYSNHVSRYGSVPAALHPSPGTEVEVSVLHLTERQLRLISETEPNYDLRTLAGARCLLEGGCPHTELRAYLSRHGCLLVDGKAVALSAVPARQRRFPAMGQRQALEHMRDTHRPGQPLERFVAERASPPAS